MRRIHDRGSCKAHTNALPDPINQYIGHFPADRIRAEDVGAYVQALRCAAQGREQTGMRLAPVLMKPHAGMRRRRQTEAFDQILGPVLCIGSLARPG
jgi:hypothetical protein